MVRPFRRPVNAADRPDPRRDGRKRILVKRLALETNHNQSCGMNS